MSRHGDRHARDRLLVASVGDVVGLNLASADPLEIVRALRRWHPERAASSAVVESASRDENTWSALLQAVS